MKSIKSERRKWSKSHGALISTHKMGRDFPLFKNNKIILFSSPTEMKSGMMQDTPTTFTDCAAIFKSGSTQSGVYTLTIPNTTVEVKVRSACISKQRVIFNQAVQCPDPGCMYAWRGMAPTHPRLLNLVNKTMHTSVWTQSTVLCFWVGQWS